MNQKKRNKAKAEIVAKKKAELAAAEAAKQAEEAAAAAPAEEAVSYTHLTLPTILLV